MNGVQYFFKLILFSFNRQNYIYQSAKKSEIMSFPMTSLHVDLNEAAKCVDIIPQTHVPTSLIVAVVVDGFITVKFWFFTPICRHGR